MDARELKVRELIGSLEAIADINRRATSAPSEWSDKIQEGAETLRALLAENAQLKQTIETMKANEREKYASAAKALGVVAPCDRATLLNEKGE